MKKRVTVWRQQGVDVEVHAEDGMTENDILQAAIDSADFDGIYEYDYDAMIAED